MDRLLTFALIVGALLLGYAALRRWQMRRVAGLADHDPLLATLRPGVPTIVYFTTPTCAPCQTRQKPALRALLADLGDSVQIVEVDAMAQPDAANRWGVLSVPTTFILDRQGRPRQVNYGVAGADKLKRQLQGVA